MDIHKEVRFSRISLTPRTVPGAWPAFNKYLFNEKVNESIRNI